MITERRENDSLELYCILELFIILLFVLVVGIILKIFIQVMLFLGCPNFPDFNLDTLGEKVVLRVVLGIQK